MKQLEDEVLNRSSRWEAGVMGRDRGWGRHFKGWVRGLPKTEEIQEGSLEQVEFEHGLQGE